MRDYDYPESLKRAYWETMTDNELKTAIDNTKLLTTLGHCQQSFAKFIIDEHVDTDIIHIDHFLLCRDYYPDKANITILFFRNFFKTVVECFDALQQKNKFDEETSSLISKARGDAKFICTAIDMRLTSDLNKFEMIDKKIKRYFVAPIGRDVGSCSDFKRSLQALRKSPDLDTLKEAFANGQKYLAFVDLLYSYIGKTQTDYEKTISNCLNWELTNQPITYWKYHFSKYRGKCYFQWLKDIGKFISEHTKKGMVTDDPAVIRLLTVEAYRNREIISTFENLVQRFLHRLKQRA